MSTEIDRQPAPTSAQIDRARRCPLVHEVRTGSEVDVEPGPGHLSDDHWVMPADITGRPARTRNADEPSRPREMWHNPGFEFVVFDPISLRETDRAYATVNELHPDLRAVVARLLDDEVERRRRAAGDAACGTCGRQARETAHQFTRLVREATREEQR